MVASWRASHDPEESRPNVWAVQRRLEKAIAEAHEALSGDVAEEEFLVYEESVHFALYQRYYPRFTGEKGGWVMSFEPG